MSEAILLRKWMARKTGSFRDFMQGVLMLSVVILSFALAALVAGNPVALEVLQSLKSTIGAVQTDALEASAKVFKTASLAEEDKSATLTPKMRAALDFVSRRYRVSAEALDPVFLAAQSAGTQMNLDPLLIVAVIAIESRFNPFAQSVVGAQGLMQVVPRWHQDKIPEGGGALTLFDPKTNVQVGAQILRESIRHMGGLVPGLQQFTGSVDDPDQTYATKVLAEKRQLENAVRRGHGD